MFKLLNTFGMLLNTNMSRAFLMSLRNHEVKPSVAVRRKKERTRYQPMKKRPCLYPRAVHMQARVDLRPVGCMHGPRASALLRQVVFWQRARQIDLPLAYTVDQGAKRGLPLAPRT